MSEMDFYELFWEFCEDEISPTSDETIQSVVSDLTEEQELLLLEDLLRD